MDSVIFQRKGLSIERLGLLRQIAQAGSIRGAVGEDSVRQSLASRQMKELAEWLGAPLWHRNGRSIELSPEGHSLAQLAGEFLSKLEELARETQGRALTFRLGAGDSIFQWYVLPRLEQWASDKTMPEFVSYSYSSAEIAERTRNGHLDAGIIRMGVDTGRNVTGEDIGQIDYALFVPEALLGAKMRTKDVPNLHDMPFCTLIGGGQYAQDMQIFLAAHGAKVALNCVSMTQMFGAVLSGRYAAVLPERALNGLSQMPIKRFGLAELSRFRRKVMLIYPHDRVPPPLILALMRTICQ
ncbi:LysR family transcriptional regulator [bacterium]|nr:LysR family transcriptional regulator [bacterium]MBP1589653.1 LysR family transcriptional regulator [Kiritimatiellia bacterium]